MKTGIAGGAGLIVAAYFATGGEHIKIGSKLWNSKADMSAPNAWLSISKDGTVTIGVNHTELGQGITTALPMIIAEELEACWDLVRFEIAPAECVYKNPLFGAQMTAASTSVKSSWDVLRKAGATAREMLIAAGAQNWNVSTSECRAEKGSVIHAPSGRKLGYGLLAQKAATLPPPKEVRLKTPDDFKIIGQRIPRLDTSLKTAARIAGMGYKNVHIHTPFVGGGFGRRIAVDYVAEAVQISKAIKAPVKVIWSRSEDIQHDLYLPATYNVLRAEINDQGFPIAWTHRIVGSDHMAQMFHRLIPSMLPYWVPRGARNIVSSLVESIAPRVIPGKKASEGAAPLSYAIDNVFVDYVNDDPGIPTGFWRSVAHSLNAFCVESFIDEIAVAGGQDPFELRMELLKGTPRLQKVLKLAAQKARWESSPPERLYRAIAAHDFHETMLAFVVEISVDDNEEIRVRRVTCALDCGIVINPKIVEAQIRGGIAFGLTAALKSEITIRKSRVVQSNFDDFPLLRMDEMPEVEVHIVPSTDPPHGIGESAVPLIGPAVTNAVYAATGKRIRKLLMYSHDLEVN